MKSLTATEIARNFSRVLDEVERGAEDVVVIRNNHPVARIIPGAPRLTAMEAMRDLHGILDDETGRRWIKDSAQHDRPLRRELRDPWA